MTAPLLAGMHPVDAQRRYDRDVAELIVAYRDLQARHEQLAARVDELLDTTPETKAAGLRAVADIDDLLRAA